MSAPTQFEQNLQLLLRMVDTPYFTEQSVEKERGIIAQEIRMYEDSPGSRVYEQLFATMFQSHPIRVPIAGTVESIGHITAKTLELCHDTFYQPANSALRGGRCGPGTGVPDCRTDPHSAAWRPGKGGITARRRR